MAAKLYRIQRRFRTRCGLKYTKDTHPTHPYVTRSRYIYRSKRYNKWVTVPHSYRSDGATGAFDIVSLGWWVHDVLCDRGCWDDGTKVTNWQNSRVLSDILWNEGRPFRAIGWLVATFCMGGGLARCNGMFRLKRN